MKFIITLSLALLSFPVSAQETIDCDNVTSQIAMNICSEQEFTEANQTLQERYTKILAAINDPAQKSLFQNAQDTWENYRQLQCDFDAGKREDSGTMWPMVMNSCLTHLTEQRLEALEPALDILPHEHHHEQNIEHDHDHDHDHGDDHSHKDHTHDDHTYD